MDITSTDTTRTCCLWFSDINKCAIAAAAAFASIERSSLFCWGSGLRRTITAAVPNGK
jgi:hypothetical protein